MVTQTAAGYSFDPSDLRIGARTPGISIFMRVRNGADFLEAAIRSHAEAADEIVAVYNQCTDGSDAILHRLRDELGPKLRLIHYLDRVYPPGSDGHARTAPDAPASFVNMSNFALAQTRHTIAMKLDDDHLAIDDRFGRLAERVRKSGFRLSETLCFSGINLARDESGKIGIPAHEPLVGTGDHFLFEVKAQTCFRHDARFEHFQHVDRRVFGDITYWHLKYLKNGLGFANAEADPSPNPRFTRKKERLMANRTVLTVDELRVRIPGWVDVTRFLPLPEKTKLKMARAHALRIDPPVFDVSSLPAGARRHSADVELR